MLNINQGNINANVFYHQQVAQLQLAQNKGNFQQKYSEPLNQFPPGYQYYTSHGQTGGQHALNAANISEQLVKDLSNYNSTKLSNQSN